VFVTAFRDESAERRANTINPHGVLTNRIVTKTYNLLFPRFLMEEGRRGDHPAIAIAEDDCVSLTCTCKLVKSKRLTDNGEKCQLALNTATARGELIGNLAAEHISECDREIISLQTRLQLAHEECTTRKSQDNPGLLLSSPRIKSIKRQ
jgi:hypothetical protein